jgi:hypothetical protein
MHLHTQLAQLVQNPATESNEKTCTHLRINPAIMELQHTTLFKIHEI